MKNINIPLGFRATGWNAGIKDNSFDFGVLHSDVPGSAAAVFTKNNYPGNPVIVGREHIKKGVLQTIVVNSKNANVSSGPSGLQLAYQMCAWTGEALGVRKEHILPSSTGVIGRIMPADKIEKACRSIPENLKGADIESFAKAIMTTDTFPKILSERLDSGITILGIAKGAGMIEPNMATMLAFVLTDAEVENADLDRLLRFAAERTFNRVSVDTDTSTSDTFAIIANGKSEKKIKITEDDIKILESCSDPFSAEEQEKLKTDTHCREFIRSFLSLSLGLARMIARDGEGATKLIQVSVEKARERKRALKIAKSVVNSPLLKSAIYGKDPNWGRIVMAVGKVFDEPVPYEQLEVYLGSLSLKDADEDTLKLCSEYLGAEEVHLRIVLNEGSVNERVWGCDLTEDYVKINAHYTT